MMKPNPEWSAEAQRSNCSLRQLFRRPAGQVSGPPGLWLYAGVHPGNGLECVPRGIAKSEMGGWTMENFVNEAVLKKLHQLVSTAFLAILPIMAFAQTAAAESASQ